ncbi:helix-hairpin-helix domain-containing protein [Zeaxanthinibacter enoshimensis]|uniref:helix-hairpin-helix domain-containing protein n=1 Tax=Zeaxanthinibacter enoshimensis TaxID=392009 RepID=UPI003561A61F
MKTKKPHLVLSKRERSGVFFLLLFVLIFLCVKWWILKGVHPDDSFYLDEELQARHDSLVATREAARDTIYPFNPNYLDDSKGYRLGLSPGQLDSLYAYRQKGLYMRSVRDFARVTGVPDSLLQQLSPYFRFPALSKPRAVSNVGSPAAVRDINKATADELQQVRGIGPVLSSRIVRFRDALGGFVIDEQLYEVYGLDSVTVRLVLDKFKVTRVPEIQKINLNTATVDELAALVYIPYGLAWEIVRYRERVGKIRSLDELTQLEDFPSDKIDRIGLYLFL